MMTLPWKRRSPEEARLFNPAFLGLLIHEFVKDYSKAKGEPCPIPLPFCALPIALHAKTRTILPSTTLTSLYTWREKNPNALVGYVERAISLRSLVQEAIRFNLERSVLSIDDQGRLERGSISLSVTSKFEKELTSDARECINSSKLLGRWFAKAGTTSTILAAWGIKP